MVNFSITIIFFLLFCALFQFQPATLDEGAAVQNDAQKPLLSKVLMDTVSLLRKSHKNSWDKIKTVIKDLQMQFSPPNLEGGGGGIGVGEDMKGAFKEAIAKSLEKNKEIFEESAKSAGKAVETTVHKTTIENNKETTHDSEHESKEEL